VILTYSEAKFKVSVNKTGIDNKMANIHCVQQQLGALNIATVAGIRTISTAAFNQSSSDIYAKLPLVCASTAN
jgi:hypothetical protein